MGQRLVITSEGKTKIAFSEIRKWVKLLESADTPGDAQVAVPKSFKMSLVVPNGVVVLHNRAVAPKRKSKQERAVEKQIAEHKEKKAKGETEAHVPPVAGRRPMKQKCPECNVKKPVLNVGGVKVVKPHISKGEPCAGSGEPVSKRRVAKK